MECYRIVRYHCCFWVIGGRTCCVKGFNHCAFKSSHFAWSYVGSWHGDPMGTVATSFPLTVEFSVDQVSCAGQQESLGRQRQSADCAAGPPFGPSSASICWRSVAQKRLVIRSSFIVERMERVAWKLDRKPPLGACFAHIYFHDGVDVLYSFGQGPWAVCHNFGARCSSRRLHQAAVGYGADHDPHGCRSLRLADGIVCANALGLWEQTASLLKVTCAVVPAQW